MGHTVQLLQLYGEGNQARPRMSASAGNRRKPAHTGGARGSRHPPQDSTSQKADFMKAPLAGLVAAAAGMGASFSRRGGASSRADRVSRAAVDGWPGAFIPPGAGPAEAVERVAWPESWPYTVEDFSRQDESEDENFYSQPRLCTHVDDGFIARLKEHYGNVFPSYPDARILDICSSWISHYPEQKSWSHVSISGMNEYELQNNKQADDYSVRNLNVVPELPYEDASFDIVTCTVSFDYLNKPLQVMSEVARVLKPGGMVILSTSNRCFPTKAVNIWLRTGDVEHCLIYGSYMHYTNAFERPEVKDLSPPMARMGFADPVYVIQARKKG